MRVGVSNLASISFALVNVAGGVIREGVRTSPVTGKKRGGGHVRGSDGTLEDVKQAGA